MAVLAVERADPKALPALHELVTVMDERVGDFAAYRQADVRFHVGLAELTGSPPLLAAMTEAQGAMTDLIHHIAHPPEVLAWSNGQHARLLQCLEQRDAVAAMRTMAEHLRGTEHVLAGLLPSA